MSQWYTVEYVQKTMGTEGLKQKNYTCVKTNRIKGNCYLSEEICLLTTLVGQQKVMTYRSTHSENSVSGKNLSDGSESSSGSHDVLYRVEVSEKRYIKE